MAVGAIVLRIVSLIILIIGAGYALPNLGGNQSELLVSGCFLGIFARIVQAEAHNIQQKK